MQAWQQSNNYEQKCNPTRVIQKWIFKSKLFQEKNFKRSMKRRSVNQMWICSLVCYWLVGKVLIVPLVAAPSLLLSLQSSVGWGHVIQIMSKLSLGMSCVYFVWFTLYVGNFLWRSGSPHSTFFDIIDVKYCQNYDVKLLSLWLF